MHDYIPRAEDKALLWFLAFRKGIADRPGCYMTSPPEVELIWSAVERYAVEYRQSKMAETRNALTFQRKFEARVNVEGVCRLYAGLIKRNLGISDADKRAIGVPPINNTKSRIECPMSSPMLAIVAATPNGHTLEYRDSLNLDRRGKPHGATMLQLFMVIGEKNATDMTDAKFVGNFTTNPMVVIHDPADRQKQATYFARWAGKRNQFGMWSLPISMTIAA